MKNTKNTNKVEERKYSSQMVKDLIENKKWNFWSKDWSKRVIVYWDGKYWGYNYYKLGVEYDNIDVAQEAAKELRIKYGFPVEFPKRSDFYNSKDSQELLLSIANDFPNSEIKK